MRTIICTLSLVTLAALHAQALELLNNSNPSFEELSNAFYIEGTHAAISTNTIAGWNIIFQRGAGTNHNAYNAKYPGNLPLPNGTNSIGLTSTNGVWLETLPSARPAVLPSTPCIVSFHLNYTGTAMRVGMRYFDAAGNVVGSNGITVGNFTWTQNPGGQGYWQKYSFTNTSPANAKFVSAFFQYTRGYLEVDNFSIDMNYAGGNTAPVVSAGPDLTNYLPEVTTLVGNAFDFDGDAMTSAWTKVSGPGTVAFGSITSRVTTAMFSSTGTYVLALTVRDQPGNVSTDTVQVVKLAASPNLWLTNPGFNDTAGVYVDSSSGPATDSSMAGWDVTFTYTSVSNSIYTDGPPGAVPQEGPLALFVSALRPDPDQGSPSNTTYLETAVANRAAVKPGRTYNFSFAESNPGSNVLAGVRWFNATGGIVRQDLFVPSVSVYYGEWQVFTRITNAPSGALWAGAYFTMGQGYTGIDRFQLWAYPDGTNVNPFVSAGTDQKIGLGTVTQLGGAAADADGDTLTMQWSVISGPGSVTFSSTNVLNPWVAFSTNSPGTYVLRLTVNDGQGHIVTDDVNIAPSLFTGEKILIFAGQSNMEGHGTPNSVTNLTPQDKQIMSNVFGFYSHATDTDGDSAACPPTGPDLGGTPDPYGLYIYVGFGGSGSGCPYNEKGWMTARTTNGVTYDGGTWLPGYGQPKEGSASRGVYIAGGSWQPYQIWKSDYVGWTRKGPVLYNKSASFWYIGLNPGETWANATSFSTGEPMQEFGPEFTAIKAITAAYPTNIFNIVKYAPGGTDLANDWNPNASQGCYSGLVSWVRAAMLQKPGAEIAGFFWLQGESDAISLGIAPQYYQNLTNMLARLRADLATPNLPVVIAKISPGNPKDDLQNPAEWPNFSNQQQWTNSNYGIYYAGTTMGIHQVRSAQQAAADNDPLRVKAIDTADLPFLSHEWVTARTLDNSLTRAPAVAGVHWNVITNQYYSPLHYSDAGIKIIGTRMGQAWLALITNSVPPPVSGYNAWAADITNGLTNYNDSATGDGYPNLLKYATGSSPTNADNLAHMGGMSTGGVFAVTFNRNTNATDVTLIVERSISLLSGSVWSGFATNHSGLWSPTNVISESGTGSPVSVVVRDLGNADTNLYLRLRVTSP